MTDGTLNVKYENFNMVIKVSREKYNKYMGILETLLNEKWDVNAPNAATMIKLESELQLLQFFSSHRDKMGKIDFSKEYEFASLVAMSLIYNLKKYNDPKAIIEFIEGDFTNYKKKWISETPVFCEGCKINIGDMSCGRCGLKCYCSKTCQTKHWRLHKKTCKELTRDETP